MLRINLSLILPECNTNCSPPVLIVMVAGYSVICDISHVLPVCAGLHCVYIQTLVKCGSNLCLWIVASQLLTSKPFSCHEISMQIP